jgi:hypothetical protein
MKEKIIKKYTIENCSIEEICKEFQIGKLSVKKILFDNDVPLKKKGGQMKYNYVLFNEEKIKNKIVKCKKCQKYFNDIENKGGSLTSHIVKCFPEVEIISKLKRTNYKKTTGNYWHFNYFDIIDKPNINVLKCPCCDWKTTDLSNQTGSLTKHVLKTHGSIENFIKDNKDYEKYFNKSMLLMELNEYLNHDENMITCKICNEKFKTISNTHLINHNTTIDEYKKIYGNNSLISDTTKKLFIENLNNVEHNFSYRSNDEIEIENFLKENNIEVQHCNKKELGGIELDLYIPNLRVAIEYNGLYWHSEKQGKNKDYHINKTKKCVEKNIHLIHIFSDEWNEKKEIIKGRILNLVNKNINKKIFARKCEIINLTKEQKKDFLLKNHLQGNDKSSIMVGLKFEDKIVSVMTFGGLRNSLGNKKKEDNTYELYRFSSLNVIGGFSRLLKYFIKEYSPKKIITYADRNWSPDNKMCFYEKMGFNFIGETKPNYSYTKGYKKREHRFNYRKDVLIKMGFDKNKSETEIMFQNGYDRIWDTGTLKFEMIIY